MGATFCQVNRIKIYFVIFRFIEVFFGNFFSIKRKMPPSKIFFADEKKEKNAKNQHRKYKKSIQKPRLKKTILKARRKAKKSNEPIYKPSSVLRDYLSTSAVTDGLKRRKRRYRGEQPYSISPYLASGGVYTAGEVTSSPVSFYLAFSSLPFSRRFFSVALSRKSPSADVIRHPAL